MSYWAKNCVTIFEIMNDLLSLLANQSLVESY